MVNALEEREDRLMSSGSNKLFHYTPPVVAIRIKEDGEKEIRTWNYDEYDFCTIAKSYYQPCQKISANVARSICNRYSPKFTDESSSDVYFLNQQLLEKCGEKLCDDLVVSVLKGEFKTWLEENQWMFYNWFQRDKSRFVVMTDFWAGPEAHYKKWNMDEEEFSDDAGFDVPTVIAYSGRSDFTSVPCPIIIPKSVAYTIMHHLFPSEVQAES